MRKSLITLVAGFLLGSGAVGMVQASHVDPHQQALSLARRVDVLEAKTNRLRHRAERLDFQVWDLRGSRRDHLLVTFALCERVKLAFPDDHAIRGINCQDYGQAK